MPVRPLKKYMIIKKKSEASQRRTSSWSFTESVFLHLRESECRFLGTLLFTETQNKQKTILKVEGEEGSFEYGVPSVFASLA